MLSVVRPVLFAVIAAALALPALADSQKAGLRADGVTVVAQQDGPRWRGRGPFGGPRNGPQQLAPLEVVLGNVAAQFPGHHLAVDGPFQRDGLLIYRIKWLTPDGRVLIVFADAVTGRVIGHRG